MLALADPTHAAPRMRLPPCARVLIVSPYFPPVNAPDCQRVRLLLPHLAAHGWQAEILTFVPEASGPVLDPDLERTLPPDLAIHRVAARPSWWRLGLRPRPVVSRGWGRFRAAGDALLATGRFDLVFFSTTQFGVLPLGPAWRERFGVPYVLDLQDEWVSAYYTQRPEIEPPGGRLRYHLRLRQARRDEGSVVQAAAAIVSVSPRYNANLLRRHAGLTLDRLHVLPFGGERDDFAGLERGNVTQSIFDPALGRHWVQVGRGGADLAPAARGFFSALRQAIDAGWIESKGLQLHFIGTSYAPKGQARPTLAPIADECGVGHLVREHPARFGYFAALRCLREADALLLLGSDDPGYTPSKLAVNLLAGRPLLAILHRQSPALAGLRQAPLATVATFSDEPSQSGLEGQIVARWFRSQAYLGPLKPVPPLPHEFTAEAMTARLTAIFREAVRSAPRSEARIAVA